jgi:hypothetical protein
MWLVNDATKPPLLPPPPPPKSLRHAFTLNLFLPGTGQMYLGQTALGIAFCAGFSLCFLVILAIFFLGYRQYIQIATNGDIFDPDKIERIARAFHIGWLVVWLVIGVAIHVASLATLGLSKPPK